MPQFPLRRPRVGCFGCMFQVGIVLLLSAVLLTALTGLLYPWSFYLGGKFHVLPFWQGWGRAHAKSGDYLVWVQIAPTSRGSGMYLETNLTGMAYVCTPRGENIRLTLGGGMRKHLNLSTDGEAIHLYMHRWAWNGAFISSHRPSLEFRGTWRNPNLVMDDYGSIGMAFQPDGTVYRGHDPSRPYLHEVVPITFSEGSYFAYKNACESIRH